MVEPFFVFIVRVKEFFGNESEVLFGFFVIRVLDESSVKFQ